MALSKIQSGMGGGQPPTQQIFETAGTHTYTKPADCTKVKVTVVGGGGGGGGCRSYTNTSPTPGWTTSGGGGGAGGTAIKLIDGASVGATETVTVGTGGNGGNGWNGVGGGTSAQGGGQSSFGSHCTASGGSGGKFTGSGNTSTVQNHHRHGASGAGGVGTNGDLNITGGAGEKNSIHATGQGIGATKTGYSGATLYIFNTNGGASSLQGGQTTQLGIGFGGNIYSTGALSSNGGPGKGYGNGGNGGLTVNSSGNAETLTQIGGNGSPGVVIVEEFYG